MKQGTGMSASLAAMVSSVATIICCLPLGFAAAIGAAGASAFLTTLRPWLLGLSVLLLGIGFWQQRRAAQCEVRGRWLGKIFHWKDAPASVFWNGSVTRIIPGLEKALNEQRY